MDPENEHAATEGAEGAEGETTDSHRKPPALPVPPIGSGLQKTSRPALIAMTWSLCSENRVSIKWKDDQNLKNHELEYENDLNIYIHLVSNAPNQR